MSRSRSRDLTEDERILWNLVARTASPLKGKALPPPEKAKEEPAAAAKISTTTPASDLPQPKIPVQDRRQIHHLDRVTQKKISKGRLPIEARIDLHGMRQDEAYGLLLSFLNRAHASGLRYVLVITGKGRSLASDGVLKRSVPSWFATAPFRPLVSGYEDAARNHGGEGALYVRLRRLPHEVAP
jgi:DNA-nicking Smr family endonuclease